jgi:hypothetical protein
MNHTYTRLPCCGQTIQDASDAVLTRTLTHCLRALLADPHKNIQLLVNLREAAQEIERRDIGPEYVAGRIRTLGRAWDDGQDIL